MMRRIIRQSSFPVLYMLIIIAISSCTSLGKIENQRVQQVPAGSHGYSFLEHTKKHPTGETVIFMAFSGGGTRAATLSYGVLEALRDRTYQDKGQKVSLLDDVGRISSVSFLLSRSTEQ